MADKKPGVRLLLIDPDERVLLFHYAFERGPLSGKAFWALPGGPLQPAEAPADAARRELWEETGLDLPVGAPIAHFASYPPHARDEMLMDETFFLIETSSSDIERSSGPPDSDILCRSHLWWYMRDLCTTSQVIHPAGLIGLLAGQLGQSDLSAQPSNRP